eukprot:m.55359 g.55359  ORF g.55359 m.55359 type:complete len:59 (+) comp15539_c0_seq9:4821-4997(+)
MDVGRHLSSAHGVPIRVDLNNNIAVVHPYVLCNCVMQNILRCTSCAKDISANERDVDI